MESSTLLCKNLVQVKHKCHELRKDKSLDLTIPDLASLESRKTLIIGEIGKSMVRSRLFLGEEGI